METLAAPRAHGGFGIVGELTHAGSAGESIAGTGAFGAGVVGLYDIDILILY